MKKDMGIRKASTALKNLWGFTPDTMPREQLEWFAELSFAAQIEAENIADFMNTFGSLLNGADEDFAPSKERMATILFSLADQVETLAAMVQIGEAADYQLVELAKANAERQFVTATNWANYSLEVCGNRYRFIQKSTQECLLAFAAASDDEAEEVCMDYLRRRGLQAHNRQERTKKPD
jgi:hypothetical protein